MHLKKQLFNSPVNLVTIVLLTINYWNHFSEEGITQNGIPLIHEKDPNELTAESLYRSLQCNYPKFFKMDMLCKWAWVGAESLLNQHGDFIYKDLDKNKIAVVLFTHEGCLEVDKKYLESTETIPSPALFVYTLNNIMLGEICIRHGFKGEQACLVNDVFDAEELCFLVSDLLEHKDMEACLCGWVNATNEHHDVCLFWVSKDENGIILSPTSLQELYMK